jgi:hypothetical protein
MVKETNCRVKKGRKTAKTKQNGPWQSFPDFGQKPLNNATP